MPLLIDLIRLYPGVLRYDQRWNNAVITSITTDSRQIVPGALFVALAGTRYDARTHIADAWDKGVAAVLCDENYVIADENTHCVIRADVPRRALAHCAASFYDVQPKHIVAVTGTDGKTSTVNFCRQIWELNGVRAAALGTLGIIGDRGEMLTEGNNTTPDPVALHDRLRALANSGYTHVAMEASSHGLDQYRLDGVRISVGGFTNLTRDHLDYHGTEDAYFNAKARLFSEVMPHGSIAVLAQDDNRFSALEVICKARGIRVVGFGYQGRDYALIESVPTRYGQHLTYRRNNHIYQADLSLVGEFQALNVLAAWALVESAGVKIDDISGIVSQLKGVPGRLEKIAMHPNGAPIYIDYAHTPAALANLLRTLRPHTPGRLVVVFGCGGDRDKGKRPEMGAAAAALADVVIVTDDNPRSENPERVREEVLAGCPHARSIGNRSAAIHEAVQMLSTDDVLVIAGKGHEKTQIIGTESLPFDDSEVARSAVGNVG